jgi:endonuclease-8
MPEGDAVRRTAARLDAALAGGHLVRADLRVPRFSTTDLVGAEVIGTEVVGKHLLTRVRREGRALTLHHHLRMDGRWATGPPGARPLAGPGHQIRIWLATPTATAIGLRIAMIEVVRTSDEARLVGHLGPDILGKGFDEAAAAQRVQRQGRRPLAEVLLDQRVLSGLGTIWVSETAFAARATPWNPAQDTAELAAALRMTRTTMQLSLAAKRRSELPAYAVYGRLGQPCPLCGTPIRSVRVGSAPTDRIIYFCPVCQCGPAARG